MDHQIDETELIPRKEAKLRFRDQILLRWDHKCAYCRQPLAIRKATLDHVVPKVKGGLTVKENLVAACLACNVSKSAQHWHQWFETQGFYCAVQAQAIHEWINA